MSTIRKAIFPVAGMGSRFLPATKANPKEMLPIVDKPLIQYAVEEAIAAGIRELIFVTSSSKRAIEDHFDNNFELETRLKVSGKIDLLQKIQNILPRNVTCCYIRQPEPKGLGDAVLCAQTLIGNEPFALLLADDLIITEPPQPNCLVQMQEQFKITQKSVIAVKNILIKDAYKYGIIATDTPDETLMALTDIVEKPQPEDAPSQLGVVGRYILTPAIFTMLANQVKQKSTNEIELTNGISKLLKIEPAYAYRFQGHRFDCGSKLGYLEATLNCALLHSELKEPFKDYLKHFVNKAYYDNTN